MSFKSLDTSEFNLNIIENKSRFITLIFIKISKDLKIKYL